MTETIIAVLKIVIKIKNKIIEKISYDILMLEK